MGVRTDTGEEVLADVVIDAAGRRWSLTERIKAIGGRAPIATKDPSGFMYYCRHFRSDDGSVPQTIATPTMEHPSHTVLTLPADNGTWGLAIVTSAGDVALRGLKDTDNWTCAMKGHPLAAHWLDGDPIDDGVSVMANIPDEHRTFVVDGSPVATGVLAFADSWAVTNPTLGRGSRWVRCTRSRCAISCTTRQPIPSSSRWDGTTRRWRRSSPGSWKRGRPTTGGSNRCKP